MVTIILPAHNEEKNIQATLDGIFALWGSGRDVLQDLIEIVVVDDGSVDATAGLVLEYQKAHKNILLFQNGKNYGKGYALRRGVREARGEFIVFLDADGDISAVECKKLIDALRSDSGLDMAIGSKRVSAVRSANEVTRKRGRAMLRRLANTFLQFLLVPGISDTQCGVKAFRARAIKPIAAAATMNGWSFDIEILALARHRGCRIKEVPILWRESGRSHVGLSAYFRTFFDALYIFLRMRLGRYSGSGTSTKSSADTFS